MSVSIFIQVVVATYQLRAAVRWRDVIPATLIRYVTIPIGIALLLAIGSLDRAQIKQILGFILLSILLVQFLWKVAPREHVQAKWMLVAFSSSGIMLGMAAMGGPPVVLWVMAHRWSNQQTRAFLASLFMLAAPLQLVLLYVSSRGDVLGAMLTGFAFAPVVAVGSTMGVRLGNSIAKPRLRQMAFVILLLTACISILSPVLA